MRLSGGAGLNSPFGLPSFSYFSVKIHPLAKVNHIKLEDDAPSYVVGIASNERAWKLTFDLNQALGIQLEADSEGIGPGRAAYVDADSDPDYDYLMVENSFPVRKVPRIARQFRFWLVLRPKRDAESPLRDLIQNLGQVASVSLAHDLSEVDELKKLLP